MANRVGVTALFCLSFASSAAWAGGQNSASASTTGSRLLRFERTLIGLAERAFRFPGRQRAMGKIKEALAQLHVGAAKPASESTPSGAHFTLVKHISEGFGSTRDCFATLGLPWHHRKKLTRDLFQTLSVAIKTGAPTGPFLHVLENLRDPVAFPAKPTKKANRRLQNEFTGPAKRILDQIGSRAESSAYHQKVVDEIKRMLIPFQAN